jgi:Flp pilus assembly protein TadD
MDVATGAADWRVLFARASSRNAVGDWLGAEADLLAALELEPDHPELLNSLGYNWVDRGERVEEGMALIRRAVAARPDLGHIVDSFGWAYYRLGQYEQAIPHLERAAALMPNEADAVDHLGDAYWRVGRRREARFQWNQALSLNPEPEDFEKIKAKLTEGLPARSPVRAVKRPSQTARGEGQRKKRSESQVAPASPQLR